jgi:O-antigen/teichoic acid export membrane protein
MALLGPGLSQQLYGGDARIGTLAAFLSLTFLPDSFYNLVNLSLQSRRAMRTLAVLQNINQAMLVLCVVVALAAAPTPEGMVAARLAYSVSTMLIALGFYGRARRDFAVPFPAPVAVLRRALTVSPRPYWRFGVANAIDKNIANLFTEIPLQLVGILAGTTSAGYLELGYRAITIPSMFSSAVFDNLQAVVPQAVGKRDFARLWRNFRRVALTLAVASAAFYTLFALLVPLLVPLLLGVESLPAIPVIVILSVYGAITTVGGILGPLYRAFNLLREATAVKLLALAVMALPGLWLVSQSGAVGGGWVVNGLHIVSVGLTALVVLPVLRRHAARQENTQTQENSAEQKPAPL